MSIRSEGSTAGSVFFDDEVLPQIDRIISDAANRVTIVTPYLELWEHLKTKIESARRRKVEIIFIIRTIEDERIAKKRPTGDIKWLESNGVTVVQVPNLHAKIYMNERSVLLSSMNITEPSIANSRDFAVMVRSEDSVDRVRDYVGAMVERFGPPELTQTASERAVAGITSLMKKLDALQTERSRKPKPEKIGTCIRCGAKIVYDPERPLCDKDFVVWQKYRNKSYVEKYCHSCGRAMPTTFGKPLCAACYSTLN